PVGSARAPLQALRGRRRRLGGGLCAAARRRVPAAGDGRVNDMTPKSFRPSGGRELSLLERAMMFAPAAPPAPSMPIAARALPAFVPSEVEAPVAGRPSMSLGTDGKLDTLAAIPAEFLAGAD